MLVVKAKPVAAVCLHLQNVCSCESFEFFQLRTFLLIEGCSGFSSELLASAKVEEKWFTHITHKHDMLLRCILVSWGDCRFLSAPPCATDFYRPLNHQVSSKLRVKEETSRRLLSTLASQPWMIRRWISLCRLTLCSQNPQSVILNSNWGAQSF